MTTLINTVVFAITLSVIFARQHVDAVPAASTRIGPSAEDEFKVDDRDIDDRLQPLMKMLYGVPTTTTPDIFRTETGSTTRRPDCRKWHKLSRQWLMTDSSIEHRVSLARLVDAVRGLCYTLSGVQEQVRGDGVVFSVKREGASQSEDYTDNGGAWGAGDNNNGDAKGSWRQNVMRVWGR